MKISWSNAHDLVTDAWSIRAASNVMTAGSVTRYTRVFASFARYAVACRVALPGDVDPRLVRSFTVAPLPGRGSPSTSTSRFRLTVVRTAMRILIEDQVLSIDPTDQLRVAQAMPHSAPIPLTPPEVDRLRASGKLSPRDLLRPVVVEFGLLGASHLEIARAVVADVDAQHGLIEIGTPSRSRRQLPITEVTADAVTRCIVSQQRAYRLKKMDWSADEVPLALTRRLIDYPPESIAPSISSSLSRAMARAGIDRVEVRPRSVREFAANRIYAQTGDIQAVASALGIRSLDSAMRLVDEAWQSQWGEQMRCDG